MPGGRLLYTVTVGNSSTRAITGITVLVRLPVGLSLGRDADTNPNVTCGGPATCAAESETSWTLATLAAGASQTFTMNPTVVSTDVGDGNLISATVYVSGTAVGMLNAVKTVPIYSRPNVQLALGTIANPVIPGQSFWYDLDIGSIGAGVTGAELRATLPPGVTVGTISDGGTQAASGDVVWTLGSIAAGALLHRRVDVTASATAGAGTLLAARAALTHDGGAPIDAAAQSVVPVVDTAPPLAVTISAAPNPVAPGARLVYTATVRNTSARAVDGIGVLFRIPNGVQFSRTADTQPAGGTCGGPATCVADTEWSWNLGTMAAGAMQTLTVSQTVQAALTEGSLISTSTWVTATGQTTAINVQTTAGDHR